MNAKQRVAASRGEQPDDFAANGGGCDRISLRAALMKRKINPTDRESGECRIRRPANALSVRASINAGSRVESGDLGRVL
jgi:hypothetical protein